MRLMASVSENAVTLRWIKDSYVARGSVRYRILRRAQDEQEFLVVADILPRGNPADFDLGDVHYEYVVRAAIDRFNIDMVDATVEVVTAAQ